MIPAPNGEAVICAGCKAKDDQDFLTPAMCSRGEGHGRGIRTEVLLQSVLSGLLRGRVHASFHLTSPVPERHDCRWR